MIGFAFSSELISDDDEDVFCSMIGFAFSSELISGDEDCTLDSGKEPKLLNSLGISLESESTSELELLGVPPFE